MANPNPQDLSDEELDKVIEEQLAPEAGEEPENPDPQEEENPEEQEEEQEQEEEPEEVEEEKKPSRREQLRISDLLNKYPQLDPAKQQGTPQATPPGALDIENDVDADEELKKRLIADRTAVSQAAYQQGLEQAKSLRFHTRLEVDAPRVETKYPALDKSSEQFKPQLAKAINTMYLNTVGYDFDSDTVQNPNIRYSDYVESVYELAAEIAGEQTAATRTNIKKQAAKTGLRPDGSKSKAPLNLNKLPHQMTDEELDAYLAQAIPSK